MNNAICICTVSQNSNLLNNDWPFTKSHYGDKYLVVDKTQNPEFNEFFSYTESDIRANLNFNKNVPKENYWNSYGNRNIVWFYAYFRMLNFYLQYPGYDFYWFFDDDVIMDDWEMFFQGMQNTKADFLSYFIFKKNFTENQPTIPIIDDRTHSKDCWFQRFPEINDCLPKEAKDLYGSFFPITRYSNKAFSVLHEAHKNGYYGYGEGFVPTVLNHYGLSLDTIFSPDDTSVFFDVEQVKVKHKGIQTTWSWI